ncbi:F-box/kelch-repeat protein At3g06240-like [Papaver somniferum]|uniref:F-box/kelch-repeat protein At3g06240-like n=1 Tax=Papaver somniferum TaxID=3469 RepID=UPI000E6F6761|nr:F-box/kelch-repeat protein At3g06240-like [Papaver somniferum]XP_026436294.1 F-box/kelch-repeat protein At3g06240-like [Papaver somniferum]
MSSFLPEEIIENILTRLPVKSISRFKCVSKNWYHFFQNPNFIKNHLNHAIQMKKFNILVTNQGDIDDTNTEPYITSIDYIVLPSTSSPFVGHALNIDYPYMDRKCKRQILGSSNGLVCIQPWGEESRTMCIWNPATREYKEVPEPSWKSKHGNFVYGFGFDCKNGDYKVLRFGSFILLGEESEASVYSLASSSWKKLGSIPYNFSFNITKGFLLDGVLHWVAVPIGPIPRSSVIVCYNISDETFYNVPLPNENLSDVENICMVYLGVWEGKLCLLHKNHMEEDPDTCTHQNDHIEVWTMMDNKWSKDWKITAHMADMEYVSAIQTLPNGEILCDGGPMVDEDGIGLLAYDPNLERVRALKIHGFPECYDMETYIETLTALNSGTYVGEEVNQDREETENNG